MRLEGVNKNNELLCMTASIDEYGITSMSMDCTLITLNMSNSGHEVPANYIPTKSTVKAGVNGPRILNHRFHKIVVCTTTRGTAHPTR